MYIWPCNLVYFLSVFLAIRVIDAMRSQGWSDLIMPGIAKNPIRELSRVITEEESRRIPSETDYWGRGIFPGSVWLTRFAIFTCSNMIMLNS